MAKQDAQPCGFQRCRSSKEFISTSMKINYLDAFEHRIVIPVVVGSSPISHPKNSAVKTKGYTLQACSPFVFLEDEFQILEDEDGGPWNIPTNHTKNLNLRRAR
jgi:hypothetical protein